MKPRMFIASSAEHLEIAYAAQEGLEHELEVTVWTQGVFKPSKTAMESLVKALDGSDFGLFILAPTDVIEIRNTTKHAVRDNVIFELGLFIGKLGINRCFLIAPKDATELHLPSDLLGLVPLTFDPNRQDGNLLAALGPACSRIRKAIGEISGVIVAVQPDIPQNQGLIDDPQDCIALLESWLGHRTLSDNRRAIRYADVDQELSLAVGSARQYLEEAAKKYNLRPTRKGKDFILFEQGEKRESSWLGARRGGWQSS